MHTIPTTLLLSLVAACEPDVDPCHEALTCDSACPSMDDIRGGCPESESTWFGESTCGSYTRMSCSFEMGSHVYYFDANGTLVGREVYSDDDGGDGCEAHYTAGTMPDC